MRAVVITRPGGPEVLDVRDVARPLPREGEVLVRVHASALNRADVMQREGRYPAPPGSPADIPGLELAGEVAELGHGTRRLKEGERVFGIVGGGGNAEFAVVPERHLVSIPAGMTWQDAAAVPEAFITAHDALITQAAMRAGETVLVHAVGSGVGLAAVQLVRAFQGRCYGTARTRDKIDRARTLGLTDGVVIEGDPAAMLPPVRQWTEGKGVDVVLDLLGGPYLPASVEAAAMLGRVILIGLLAGRAADVNLGAVLSKRLTVRGTMMRARSAIEKADATDAFARDVLPLLENGSVRPVVDRVFPMDQIRDAHALMESNTTCGKVVITMP